MSDDPLDFTPPYVSPLTDEQHATIGRITLLWGQVEHYAEALLPPLTGLSWGELEAISVTERAVGSKLNLIKEVNKRNENEELKEKVALFCRLVDETKNARNHIFHGMWGWRGTGKSKKVEPAARKTKVPSQPFKAERLDHVEKQLCRCARVGSEAARIIYGWNERSKYNRYIHHDGPERHPKWLEQWSERNPLEYESLDRISKAGRLPVLPKPYPTE